VTERAKGGLAAALGGRGAATGLSAAGGAAVAAVLAAHLLGAAVSFASGWRQTALLIGGGDSIVLALIVSARRTPPGGNVDGDLATLLFGAIADGVAMFAIGVVAVTLVLGQSKPIERLGYYLAILVLVPLTVTLAWRRGRTGATDGRRQFLALATLAATAGILCLVRRFVMPASGRVGMSAVLLLALVAARAAIGLSVRFVPEAWARRSAKAAAALMPLLLAAVAAPFVPPATRSLADVAVAAAAGLLAFFAARAYGGGRGLPHIWAGAVDVAVLVACASVVVYLGQPTFSLAENQNYFLGPANDVLHGRPMLVGTFAQYGVGMMDALAALFLVVPMGYGTFTIVLGAMTTLLFVGLYVVLRWSTESLPIAVSGVVVVVILDVFGQINGYAFYPSTGVLRFGLPWIVILCSLAAARTARHRRLFDAAVLVTIAFATVWSGEAAVYCVGTAVVLACVDAAVTDASGRERLRIGALRTARLLAASVGGLVSFTLVTRVAAGAWADWGGYIEYIRLFALGKYGDLPIEPWSPGFPLAGMYLMSAVVIVLLVLTRPALVRERAVAFRAAAGLTVFGTLAYTYYLGRSHPNNLIHVSPPGVALLFVWLSILRSTSSGRTAPAVASAVAIFLGAMIVASESEDISQKYPVTPLAAVTGSAPTPTAELHMLWDNPVVEPAAERVVRFVQSLPGPRTSLTLLVTPNIATEALIRLDRANAAGSSNPCQEAISGRGAERAAREVRSLRPGAIVVFSETPQEGGAGLPIQHYTLALMEARFTLREIAHDGQGLVALRMTAPVRSHAGPVPLPPVGYLAIGCA
jgi:hypothetical protein